MRAERRRKLPYGAPHPVLSLFASCCRVACSFRLLCRVRLFVLCPPDLPLRPDSPNEEDSMTASPFQASRTAAHRAMADGLWPDRKTTMRKLVRSTQRRRARAACGCPTRLLGTGWLAITPDMRSLTLMLQHATAALLAGRIATTIDSDD